MEITVDGLESLKKTLDYYADINTILLTVARRLCEVGEPIIQATHGHHAQIDIVQTNDGYVLRAEGQDVLFIEFGTGDMAGAMSNRYDQVPISVQPGSWSKAHGGEYWRTGGPGKGFWHFGGKEYHYTPPHPAFYYAYEAMVQARPQIASEEFKP